MSKLVKRSDDEAFEKEEGRTKLAEKSRRE